MSAEEQAGGPMELLAKWLQNMVDDGAPVILQPQHKMHHGISFFAGGLSTGIADGTQIALAFWNPSGTIGLDAHITIELICGGSSFGLLYEGGELQTTGTFLEPKNRYRREAADKLAQWKGGFMPAIKSLGTKVGNKFVGGSTGANPNSGRSSGEATSGIGWILNPEQLYIMVLFNDSGATVPGHIMLEWYEED
jgi:hypothetical protein